MTSPQSLQQLDVALAIVRLPAGSGLPWWAAREGGFLCLTRTSAETSIVCEERLAPSDVEAQRGYRGFRVKGPLPFHLTGILASLATPLADSGVPIFVVSTFDTDYILIREPDLEVAVAALRKAGHSVDE